MKKRLIALLMAICLAGAPICTLAEETDYSYLEDMSVKELRALDAAIHELLGDGGSLEEQEISTEDETEAEPILMKEEEFFNDILKSYNERQNFNKGFTDSEIDMMTYEERVAQRRDVVLTEKWFADKYQNAIFDDLNIQYLCNQYVQGIDKQYKACEKYLSSNMNADDYDQWSNGWQSGYYNRCYVIVELYEYFDVPFSPEDVDVMKADADSLDALNEAETRNSQVPHETVKEVQTLLHEIGFKCWNIDGVAGKRTVKAIKRFQEMYGYEIDGMIDDELIEQLKQVKAEKGLSTETETEE